MAEVDCASVYGTWWGRLGRWLLVVLTVAVSLLSTPIARGGVISSENALPGTKAWYPLYNTAPAGAVEGYTGQVSYQAGDTLDFHVGTNPAASYRIVIYRLGYYQGLGGRQMACLPSCAGSTTGVPQPVPAPDQYGRVVAGWPVTDSLTVPASWVSGSYVAKLVLTSGASKGRSAPVPFVIRSTAPAPMLIVTPVNTGEAYNSWGGKSLYAFNSTGGVPAVKVSFDRPYAGNVLFFEQPFVFWFEKQGIDASYTTDVDVDADPAQLLSEHFVLVSAHSEYWSRGDRDAYEAARAAGVNLAFWGGDQGTWQVRYEDAGRTLVGYKLNPGDPDAGTIDASTSFRAIGRPECQILGTAFTGGHGHIPDYSIDPADLNDPWFAGAGVTAGTSLPGNNFEYDSQAPAGCLPVSTTTLFSWSGQPQYAPAVRYQWPSGSTVFSVGSFAFSMLATNAQMQRIALNAIISLDSAAAQTTSPPANQTPPTITGAATEGQTLTLDPGTWTGIPSPTFTYQWQRCDQSGGSCTPIAGATTTAYAVGTSDVGSTIDALVTATNAAGTATAVSSPTAVVAASTSSPPSDSTPPTIGGQSVVGQTLTAAPGAWTGAPAPTLDYQWERCDTAGNACVPIAGATTSSYVLVVTDVGSTIEIDVTASNTAGTASATSTATAVVTAASPPAPTTPVLDDFNRGNGSVGPNWSLVRPTRVAPMSVSSGAAVDASSSEFAWNYWNPSTFGPDSEAYATIVRWGASDVIRIGARVVSAGTTGASGYFVSIDAAGVWSILRVDGGPSTTLATGPTQPLAAGDEIAIRVVGSVITALHYTPVAGWTQVLAYDTSNDTIRYTSPGYLAIEFRTSTIDDLGGGSI